jgi:uncharacterized protein (TIGR03437 family)
MKLPKANHGWQLLIALAGLPLLVYAFSSGPPVAHTGGFGEPTCSQFGCHLSPINSGPGSVTITAPEFYASGQTYQITVRVADPNQRRWGFEMSSRSQNAQQAGTLSSASNQTQVVPALNGIQYIMHTNAGTRPGVTQGVDFVFNWTAPDTSTGTVIMHVAANAANNNFSADSGDRIYTNFWEIQPQPAAPPPAIFSGGVVNNASFALDPAPMAPGSIAAIFGTDLNDGSQVPSSSFGDDGKLVTELGGASATINGIPAPVFYSFLGQVGVQIPFELAGESSATVVATVNGQASEPRMIFLEPEAPGIFTLNQAGTGQGAILFSNTDILVAPEGSIPERTSRPAQAGENITIFCTGLGVVEPPLETGAPAGASQTPVTATVTIDGLPANVLYSGTAPDFVGLYQVDATVPEGTRIADDVEVVIAIGDKQSNPATIAVGL